MKKALLINSDITRVVSLLGHGNSICVADAGLPIPDQVERIDLAVTKHMPPLLPTLGALTSEMFVEGALIADELQAQQPDYYALLVAQLDALEKEQGNKIALSTVSHETFKQESGQCRAIVRTGECTPYANIILYAGVTF